jgi:hypothetical protein
LAQAPPDALYQTELEQSIAMAPLVIEIALECIHYEGEHQGFNFKKFVEKHNEAFLELS